MGLSWLLLVSAGTGREDEAHQEKERADRFDIKGKRLKRVHGCHFGATFS